MSPFPSFDFKALNVIPDLNIPPSNSSVGGGGAPPGGGLPPGVAAQMVAGEAIKVWGIGAFCILGWEYLICLPKEYRYIWKKRLNLPAWLYIINRYFGLIQLSFVVTLFSDVWGNEACKHMFLWEPVGALISTMFSQMILGYRVYAIHAQNKVIAIVLGLTILAEIIVGGITVSTTSPPPPSNLPKGMRPPCGAVVGPTGWLVAFWAVPLFYDAAAFVLTAYKAYEFWKREVNTPLFKIIWRDGILYFFAIFGMNVANLIIFLTVPKDLRAVNLTPTNAFQVILSCRLLLNLRSVGDRPVHASPNWVPSGGSGGTSSGRRAQKQTSSETMSKGVSIDGSYVVSSYSEDVPSPNSFQMKTRFEPRRAEAVGGIDVKVVKSTWADAYQG